jgi:hypothetical protein
MILSTAKLLDNAAPKPKEQQRQASAAQQHQGGRGNGKQRNGGRGNGGRGGGRILLVLRELYRFRRIPNTLPKSRRRCY